MASLTVRNIPDDVKRRFHQRAAANGRSMEEEGRRLIIDAVRHDAKQPLKSIGQMLFEASRPGVELPELPDSPASFASFDDE